MTSGFLQLESTIRRLRSTWWGKRIRSQRMRFRKSPSRVDEPRLPRLIRVEAFNLPLIQLVEFLELSVPSKAKV
jgi:hypothetical protein